MKGLTQNPSSSNTKLKADNTPPPPPPRYSKPRPPPKDPEPPAPPKRPRLVATQPQPVLQASYQHNDDDDILEMTSMEESYGEDGYDYGGYEGDGQGYENMVDGGIVDQNKGKT